MTVAKAPVLGSKSTRKAGRGGFYNILPAMLITDTRLSVLRRESGWNSNLSKAGRVHRATDPWDPPAPAYDEATTASASADPRYTSWALAT